MSRHSENSSNQSAIVLCIAGFDPCGGAGLLADARAISAFGAYALGVQTALVPQNTVGVVALSPTTPDLLRQQLQTLREDIEFHAVKIGLLPDVASIEIVGDFLREIGSLPVVFDPVLAPTRGAAWSSAATIDALREHILPRTTMLTPNLSEAQILSGETIENLPQMQSVARQLRAQSGAEIVLLKGGHLDENDFATDIYADASGVRQLRAPRIAGVGVRGTGCLLASAIAAQLAQGAAPLDAAARAKDWLTTQWRDAQTIGQGRRVAIF